MQLDRPAYPSWTSSAIRSKCQCCVPIDADQLSCATDAACVHVVPATYAAVLVFLWPSLILFPCFAGLQVLAEKAAWAWHKETGIHLVTVNPTFVIGPMLYAGESETPKFMKVRASGL